MIIISQTFQRSATKWYTSELNEIKKGFLQNCLIKNYYYQIVKRFKIRMLQTLQLLTFKHYFIDNAQSGRTLRAYI